MRSGKIRRLPALAAALSVVLGLSFAIGAPMKGPTQRAACVNGAARIRTGLQTNWTRISVFGVEVFTARFGKGWCDQGPSFTLLRGAPMMHFCYRFTLSESKSD